MSTTPVPFDPDIEPALAQVTQPDAPPFTPETIPAMRAGMAAMFPPAAVQVGDAPVDVVERTIPGPDGAPDLEITIISPRGLTGTVPGLYNIHGGGMMVGHRNMDVGRLLALVLELNVVAVNVEYRLAPEHPDPAPVEDCYAGLVWMSKNAAELNVDPNRIVVMGGSAGGGLSAGVALLARDRGGPALAGQLLLCPMIDDTNTTVASHQYKGIGTWTREANLAGWFSLLGDKVGTDAVSPYAAPTRATDLSNLPPAFIEVGSAEPFRDEDTQYALRIWETGGQAELHVWSGAFHGFDMYVPEWPVSKIALETRNSWFRRVLGLEGE
ncbi:alpha/beta hydrolase [Actinokineospora auranticolor]|uniref:Acetyl esterase/lipase n=1 Tax=Actinokineospora auranticolor TaxID=155976 RepID=A0A2S6H1I4_9PSEU|nr:alpha/beta hydrolase [Actinokineospora auranticolor]PPK71276.1 acetyl esterase/lipase [Actinokineospora auranticolor]